MLDRLGWRKATDANAPHAGAAGRAPTRRHNVRPRGGVCGSEQGSRGRSLLRGRSAAVARSYGPLDHALHGGVRVRPPYDVAGVLAPKHPEDLVRESRTDHRDVLEIQDDLLELLKTGEQSPRLRSG